jgi:hypothetical protein
MTELDDYQGQIVPMILHQMKTHLESELVLNVPDNDPTRALLVEIGRFRKNPLKINVYVALSGGNPVDPEWLDGRIDNDQLDDIQMRNLPVGEIGGGTYWWRRGVAEFACYFVRESYELEVATMYAYEFYGRLLNVLDHLVLSGTDQFQEKAGGKPCIEGSTFFASGGAGKHIWRGKLFWRVLTWRQ